MSCQFHFILQAVENCLTFWIRKWWNQGYVGLDLKQMDWVGG